MYLSIGLTAIDINGLLTPFLIREYFSVVHRVKVNYAMVSACSCNPKNVRWIKAGGIVLSGIELRSR